MITYEAREERGRGVPLTDVERVARHYNVTIEEACQLLAVYTPEELLPERGYGLTVPAIMVGSTVNELGTDLNTMESSLPIGGQARLELCTQSVPTEEDLAELYLKAIATGFHLSYPISKMVDGIPTTELVLTKGSPQWFALISILPTLFIVGLIGFGLARIESIAKAIFPIVIAAVVGLIAVVGLMRAPIGRVAERATQRYLPNTERRYGSPRTERERSERHKQLYPGERVPERGYGQKKVLAVR